MANYPGSSVNVYFEHRTKSTDALTNAATVSILVKDPSTVTRVPYSSANLVNVSEGVYRYTFTIPAAVLPGMWYAEVTSGIDPDIDVKRAYFSVEE